MSRVAELHTSLNHFVFGNPLTRRNTQEPCELCAYDGNMLEFEACLLIFQVNDTHGSSSSLRIFSQIIKEASFPKLYQLKEKLTLNL